VNVAIRAAAKADLDTLAAMARTLAAQLNLPFTATPDRLRAALLAPTPHAHVLIAEDTAPTAARTPAGFAAWHYDFDVLAGATGIQLTDMFLENDWRGRGIALGFFRTLARRAIADGCTHLRWSARVGSAPGMVLYQSLSAIPIAAWTSRTLAGDSLHALAAPEGTP
jgi:GNAT superfamily N-acetyltransferase